MTDAGFVRLQDLFDAATQLPPAAREAFARDRCGDDAGLLAELLRLLAREHGDGGLRDTHIDALDATLRRAVPALDAPRTVGPFTLLEPLGSGGMGQVHRARRTLGDVDHDVALKLIRGDAVNAALLRRFSAERRMLAALNHPGICRFLDAGTTADGVPYVAMELIQGRPLFDHCDAHAVGIAARMQLFRRILAAVAHAHRHLVVHRDIKSSNVLVDADGQPKLLDFGIAKSLAGQHADLPTSTAERFFTPANAAPEQLRGDLVGVGCDIYALGALGYELLCGLPPFDFRGLRAGEIERLLLDVPPPRASERAAAVSADAAQRRGMRSAQALARALAGDLDAIFARCLRKSPAERYRSVEALDDDIGRWLEQRPLRARSGERAYRARRFVARNRVAVAATALFAATLAAAAIALGWQALRLQTERNRAIAERDRAQQATTLLKDAFLGADPARGAGVDVRVRDVLRAAKPRLDALFELQPQTYAELADTLADVEFALGDRRGAAELAERAAGAATRAGAPPQQIHRLLAFGALSHAAVDDLPRARALLQQARGVLAGGSALEDVAEGVIQRNSADYAAAVRTMQRAVQRYAGAPPTDELALYARWQLAEALRADQQFDAALTEFDRTLAWQRAVLPPGHPSITRTRLRRSESLRQVGRVDAALAELDAVGADIERLYGDTGSFAAQYHGVRALALGDAGRHAEALAQQRLAVAAWQASAGDANANARRGLLNLAMMVAETPDGSREADALYAQAVALSERVEGSGANIVLYARANHAALLLREQRHADALHALVPAGGVPPIGEHVHPQNRADYLDALRRSAEAARCVERLRADAADGLATLCASAAAALDRAGP